MRRAALTLLPLFTLFLASCATPGGAPHAAAGADCRATAAAPAHAGSGAMAGMPMHDAMHQSMHERMHGSAATGEHRHDDAAAADCAPAR